MLFLNSVRVAPGVRSALAVACGLALSGAGMAQAQDGVEPVVVTASRMPQLLQTAPIGATVITAEQIARSGVADANEAIRKLGGVAAKSDLYGGREYSLDLRGFGGTADQNLVVVVDGIRVSENEQATARLSAIPLDMVDRIEIVRGGSSVMWGEGASAGVVNVILKKPLEGQPSSGKLSADVSTFGGQGLAASGQLGLGKTVLDASLKRVRSDGFRDNGYYKQDVAGMGLNWADGAWQAGLRMQQEDQKGGLPGSVTYAQYLANRRATLTPQDYFNARETRYSANASYKFEHWTMQMDMGQRTRKANYEYVYPGSSPTESSSIQGQITPRVVYENKLAEVGVRAVLGVDWQGWDFDKSGVIAPETGAQENRAGFIQAELNLPSLTRVSLGWREEHVRKMGDFPGDGYYAAVNYERKDKLHAGELGISQTVLEGWDIYGRLASSYRLANVDENRLTPSNGALLPQTNRDREVGLKWSQGVYGGVVRYFTQDSDNEIVYVSPLNANANIDPTRRRGAELEGNWSPTRQVTFRATWQQLSARYRAGSNDGKEMVLVSPHTATARVSYRVDAHNTVDVGAQYLASMRSALDADNACTYRIPSSTLLDARYAWSDRVWTVALSGTNLADKKGYNYDYSCTASSIYPYEGRSLKLTVARQF